MGKRFPTAAEPGGILNLEIFWRFITKMGVYHVSVLSKSEKYMKTIAAFANTQNAKIKSIGMFYIILYSQIKYFGMNNRILTPYMTPYIMQMGGIGKLRIRN